MGWGVGGCGASLKMFHVWIKVIPQDHWQDEPNVFNYYGYNFTSMKYPIVDEETYEKLDKSIDLPDILVPDQSTLTTCSHGLTFSPNDADLVLRHSEVKIYDDSKEETVKIKVFGRTTEGHCKVE